VLLHQLLWAPLGVTKSKVCTVPTPSRYPGGLVAAPCADVTGRVVTTCCCCCCRLLLQLQVVRNAGRVLIQRLHALLLLLELRRGYGATCVAIAVVAVSLVVHTWVCTHSSYLARPARSTSSQPTLMFGTT
jgi:hypothetical protein